MLNPRLAGCVSVPAVALPGSSDDEPQLGALSGQSMSSPRLPDCGSDMNSSSRPSSRESVCESRGMDPVQMTRRVFIQTCPNDFNQGQRCDHQSLPAVTLRFMLGLRAFTDVVEGLTSIIKNTNMFT